jgi:protein-S-isoprenylcysteine O-methyltransferase Ste14
MKKKIQLAIVSVIITQVIPLIGRPELILHYKNLVIIAAIFCIWLFQPAVTAKETADNKNNDGYSVVLILVMSLLSNIVPLVDWAYFKGSESENMTATVAGFILLWSGIFLRNYSIKLLGKHFTPTVQLQKDHTLITTGPYNIIRHPSYTGALLSFVGIAIFLNSLIGAVFAILAMMLAYFVRISAEEKALVSLFGDVYRNYQHKTKRLIPFLW